MVVTDHSPQKLTLGSGKSTFDRQRLGEFGRKLWRYRLVFLIYLPTLLATLYFGALASDQYESESRFVVRSATRTDGPGALSMLLGIGRSQDDAYAVQDYLTSRDAVRQLEKVIPLQEVYGDREADFLSRYPSLLYGTSEEEFYKFFQREVAVSSNATSGIVTFRVKAFRAKDARDISLAMLAIGEQVINRMNSRIQRDAIATSEGELLRSQQRLISAQLALADFRRRELMIDPVRNAASLSELIAKLSAELAQTRAHVADVLKVAPDTPQLAGLRRRAQVLEEQIAFERARITSASDGLAERIGSYDRLGMERDFANRMMIAAETELAKARNEALRQQLYLERIVEPQLADYPVYPRRLTHILTIFASNTLIFFVGWLIVAGVQEHAAQRR